MDRYESRELQAAMISFSGGFMLICLGIAGLHGLNMEVERMNPIVALAMLAFTIIIRDIVDWWIPKYIGTSLGGGLFLVCITGSFWGNIWQSWIITGMLLILISFKIIRMLQRFGNAV